MKKPKSSKKIGDKSQVAGTNSCSSVSKYSTVIRRYCQDDYLKYFVANGSVRSPIINRGYYVRFKAIEYGWQQVLESNQLNIIISLGCGFDTSPFRYKNHLFIEIDYSSVCGQKAEIIKSNNLIKEIRIDDIDPEFHIVSSNYILVGADLRKPLKVVELLRSKIIVRLINESLHNSGKYGINLILFNECSLCYIEQEISDHLLQEIIKSFQVEYSSRLSLMINYLGYEMLQSYQCQNDFGTFLLNHFKTLGAPILTFINETKIKERFTRLGFRKVDMINMKWFCREVLNLNLKESQRIKSIEPFDEWEELDNVCASYCLTICKKIDSDNQPNHWHIEDFEKEVIPQNLPFVSHQPIISVFGHSTTFDPVKKSIKIFGGFGMEPTDSFLVNKELNISQSSGHKRLGNIVELSMNDFCNEIIAVNVIKSHKTQSINRVHCRVVQLDDDHFLLSGGRTSPSKPLPNSIVKIDPETNDFDFCDISTEDCDVPATYRHVFSYFGSDSGKLIQFGGINFIPNESIYVFDIKSLRWFSRKIPNLPTDCHSLSFNSFGSHSILFNGGLDQNDNYIETNFLELIDNRDPVLKHYSIQDMGQKLYSHQMKISENQNEIYLIGGIGNRMIANDIYCIDFRFLKLLKKYRLQANDKVLLLHNFTTESVGSKQLWTIGGGGNCFSFGTHFNPLFLFEFES